MPLFKSKSYKGYGWTIVSQSATALDVACMYKNTSIFVHTIKTRTINADEIEAELIKVMQAGKR